MSEQNTNVVQLTENQKIIGKRAKPKMRVGLLSLFIIFFLIGLVLLIASIGLFTGDVSGDTSGKTAYMIIGLIAVLLGGFSIFVLIKNESTKNKNAKLNRQTVVLENNDKLILYFANGKDESVNISDIDKVSGSYRATMTIGVFTITTTYQADGALIIKLKNGKSKQVTSVDELDKVINEINSLKDAQQ